MAAGLGGNLAEVLKADVEMTANMLLPLFNRIWTRKKCQLIGKTDLSSNCPKKETSNFKNYRGIIPLSVSGTVHMFNRILL
jgi:hypothetical protein